MVDRTRSRLDVPVLRTLFGAKARPHRDRSGGPPRLAVVIETARYDLTLFKVHFGLLTLKGYTKGERVLPYSPCATTSSPRSWPASSSRRRDRDAPNPFAMLACSTAAFLLLTFVAYAVATSFDEAWNDFSDPFPHHHRPVHLTHRHPA